MSLVIMIAMAGLQLQTPGSEWRLNRELRIGSLNDPKTTIGAVSSVVITSARDVVVADALSSAIIVFGWDGRFVRRFGRSGNGPGEFRTLGRIGIHRDTLWAADLTLRRITFFSPIGAEVRTQRVETPTLFVGLPLGILANGAVVCVEAVPTRAIVQKQVTGYALMRWAKDQPGIDTIAWLDKRHSFGGKPTPEGGFRTIRQPFTNESLSSVDSRGGGLAVIHQPDTLLPRNEYQVVRYDSLGRRQWARTIRYEPLKLTNEIVQRAGASFLQALGESKLPDGTAESMRKDYESLIYVPKNLPPATDVFLAQSGEIWVRREKPQDATVRWEVLSTSGVPIGRLMLSVDARIVAAMTDFVFVSELDADGSPSVARYRIMRPPASRNPPL